MNIFKLLIDVVWGQFIFFKLNQTQRIDIKITIKLI